MNNLGSNNNVVIYGFPNTGKTSLITRYNLSRFFDTDDAPEIFQNGLNDVEKFRVDLVKSILEYSSQPRVILTNLPTSLNLNSDYDYFAFLPNLVDLRKNRHIDSLGYKTILQWYISALRNIYCSIERNSWIRLFITNNFFISDVISFNGLDDLIYNDHSKVSFPFDVLNALEEIAMRELTHLFID